MYIKCYFSNFCLILWSESSLRLAVCQTGVSNLTSLSREKIFFIAFVFCLFSGLEEGEAVCSDAPSTGTITWKNPSGKLSSRIFLSDARKGGTKETSTGWPLGLRVIFNLSRRSVSDTHRYESDGSSRSRRNVQFALVGHDRSVVSLCCRR